MADAAKKVCILNGYQLTTNTGGPVGVFRESFSRVTGSHWEMRSFSEVSGRTAAPKRWFYRMLGPSLKNYPRDAMMHPAIADNAAHFSSLRGIRNYPAVWFSDLMQYFACRPLLAPNQKAILQLHYPELPSHEVARHGWYNRSDQQLFADAEQWAWRDADFLVLANEGAEEIYAPLGPRSKPIVHLQNALPGDDAGEIPLLSRQHTNFVFVGRRNAVKGFDLLIDAFQAAHAVNPKLRLYLLGNGEPVNAPGIVDLGFSGTPAKWLAAASCVLIPNRSSYLDLNLLETLSLNTPVMMTCTQGHSAMRGASSAIYEVETATVDCLKAALLDAPRWLAELHPGNRENRLLFERQYSLEPFARQLDAICAGIIGQTHRSGARS